MKRVGIYSGTFNPVHAGHVGFALQALETAALDVVYFLPERRPRNKTGVEHFGHRVAMLKRATKPHVRLGVLELEDIDLSVERTLPRLQKRFPGAQLVMVLGSDVAATLKQWSHVETLLQHCELIVGVRASDDMAQVHQALGALPQQPKASHVITSFAADVSSGSVREALGRRQYVPGLLRSVERYSARNWLYISLR